MGIDTRMKIFHFSFPKTDTIQNIQSIIIIYLHTIRGYIIATFGFLGCLQCQTTKDALSLLIPHEVEFLTLHLKWRVTKLDINKKLITSILFSTKKNILKLKTLYSIR